MKIFEELAAQVAKEWQKRDHNLEAFTAIATTALADFKYDWSLEILNRQLRSWALRESARPAQISVYNTFGQPSITLFNNERFAVDLYFWVDFDTSIHSHGFRGAFKVIHGESLQEVFRTPVLETISDDLIIVDMADAKVEKLAQGSVRSIAPGSDLTHRVIHLTNPTVSLCVKTINEPVLKQWTYLPSGLAIQRQNLSADLIKKVYVCQYLLSQAGGEEFLSSLLDGLKRSEQIHLYEEIASGALGLREEVVEAMTGAILGRHESEKWWGLYEEDYLNQEAADEMKARLLRAARDQ